MKSFINERYGRLHFHHSLSEKPNPDKFERHCHNNYELIYVIRGQGKYVVEGAEYPLCPNTVLFLRPYEYHYVCPQKDVTYERYVIHFSETLFFDAVRELSMVKAPQATEAGAYFPAGSISPLIRSQLEILDLDFVTGEEKRTNTPSRSDTVIRTAINQILILLSYQQPDTPVDPEAEWVGKVIRYLNENLSHDLSLEETARHFFVSKYHLCHAFREHTGISVFAYLTAKRIAMAEQLLEDGLPATEVALQVGFHDYSVFYRAYRKLTGQSPAKKKRKM